MGNFIVIIALLFATFVPIQVFAKYDEVALLESQINNLVVIHQLDGSDYQLVMTLRIRMLVKKIKSSELTINEAIEKYKLVLDSSAEKTIRALVKVDFEKVTINTGGDGNIPPQ